MRVVVTPQDQGPQGQGPLPAADAQEPLAKKACAYFKTVKTVTKAGVAPGEVVVRFKTRKAKKKLAPGRYRATVTVLDAAGNASNTLRVKFRIVRR